MRKSIPAAFRPRRIAGPLAMAMAASIVGVGCQAMLNSEVRGEASYLLKCPSEQLVISRPDERLIKVDGCGRQEYWVNWVASVWTHTHDLRTRASFDLRCPKEQLTFTLLSYDSRQMGVEGCRQQATYTLVRTSQSSGAWTADFTRRTP
jgi:hypothetical protein